MSSNAYHISFHRTGGDIFITAQNEHKTISTKMNNRLIVRSFVVPEVIFHHNVSSSITRV